jgi:replicative DNA helicase
MTDIRLLDATCTDPFAEHVVVGMSMLGHADRRIGADMILDAGLRCVMRTLVDRPELLPQSPAFVDACYLVADVAGVARETVGRAMVAAVDAAELYANRTRTPAVQQAVLQVHRRHRIAQATAELDRVEQLQRQGQAGHAELSRAHAAVDAAMRSGAARVPASTSELLDAVDDSLARYRGRTHIGLHTEGLPQLSNRLHGWRGLLFLTAAPGVGKSTLLMQAGFDAVLSNSDACLVYLSLEMPCDTMMRRLLCHASGIADRDLLLPIGHKYRPADIDAKYLQAHGQIQAHGNRIRLFGLDDVGMMGGTTDPARALDQLVDIVDRAKSDAGCSRAFVVVDSLQRLQLRLESPVKGRWDALERDAYATSALMSAWHRIGTDDPVAVVAHSTKSGMDRPDMTDVRGSGDIVYGGECVLSMYRPKPDDVAGHAAPEQLLHVEILKGRDLMDRGVVDLRFDHPKSQFVEGWT